MKDPKVLASIASFVAEKLIATLRHEIESRFVERSDEDTKWSFDRVCDERAKALIRDLLPDSVFVSEESDVTTFSSNPRYVVVVDPVDGSNNYGCGIPFVASCVAIAYASNPTLEGIMASAVATLLGDVYVFIHPRTVIKNFSVVNRRSFSNLVSIYVEDSNLFEYLYNIIVKKFGFKIRCLGSIATELTYVAEGRLRGAIDLRNKLRNVDIAASYPMLKALNIPIVVKGSHDIDRVTKGLSIIAIESEIMEYLRSLT